MSKFIQLHLLTSYPPSNLNRDDMGAPKTARVGGHSRLRVSSQCLKRTWRKSEVFESAMKDHLGTRTKELGKVVYRALEGKIPEKKAKEWARSIAGEFGKLKGEKKDAPLNDLEIEQLAHLSPVEFHYATVELPNKLATSGDGPTPQDLAVLRKDDTGVDIALFGRMLASKPEYNVEAAAQVSHAITVHAVTLEDDYFTAVDDLNYGQEDKGASHIGEAGFASGLYYTYICIDTEQLHENLNNPELEKKAIRALTEAAAKVAPKGKQNSFASRGYASYILATKGDQQPCSLSVAFLNPVRDQYLEKGISAIKQTKKNLESAYGDLADSEIEMDTLNGGKSLNDVLDFVSQ